MDWYFEGQLPKLLKLMGNNETTNYNEDFELIITTQREENLKRDYAKFLTYFQGINKLLLDTQTLFLILSITQFTKELNQRKLQNYKMNRNSFKTSL